MRSFLATLIVFAGLGCAQQTANPDNKPAPPSDDKKQESGTVLVRRLESVSWNPVRAELTWLVSVWDVAVSTEQPTARERYVIHLDNAVMEFEGKSRSFDETEARHVRTLMDVISTYAVESTVWWGRGEGEADREDQSSPAQKSDPGAKTDPAPKNDQTPKTDNPSPKTKEKPDLKDEKPKPSPKSGVAAVRVLP